MQVSQERFNIKQGKYFLHPYQENQKADTKNHGQKHFQTFFQNLTILFPKN